MSQNSKNNAEESFVVDKKTIFTKTNLSFLAIIGFVGIIIRLHYFPYELPIGQDGLFYFIYALELSFNGQFPEFHLANNGWPTLVSFFFSMFQSDSFFNYIYIQRILSLSISVLTIIPVYLLCTRFVNKSFALIGAAIFAFEPRIIQNSLLGLTEPLYILLVSIGLFLFLSDKTKFVYLAFGIFALFSLVRFEGIIIIIPISIMFFLRYRKNDKVILKYLIAISIFILVLLPMAYIRIETTGQDGFSQIFGGPRFISTHVIDGVPHAVNSYAGNEPHERFFSFIILGLKNLFQYTGWVLIPVFIFFIPYGIFKILKNRGFKEITIILVAIALLIPAFYAYGRELQDTRFLYVIFPILCIVCTFTIEKITNKIKKNNYLMLIFLIGILFSSMIFLEYKKIDYEYDRELFAIANFVTLNAEGINSSTGVNYVRSSEILEKWPNLPSYDTKGRPTYDLKIFSTTDYDNIKKLIEDNREKGLTHLVIHNTTEKSFLHDVLDNEKNYPYLIEVYHSLDYNYKSDVKIYEINYEIFDNL